MGKVAAVGVLGALAFMGGRLGRKHLRRLPVKPQEVETCPVESVVDEPVPEPDKVRVSSRCELGSEIRQFRGAVCENAPVLLPPHRYWA